MSNSSLDNSLKNITADYIHIIINKESTKYSATFKQLKRKFISH